MNNIKKLIPVACMASAFVLSTSCKDSFLEIQKPDGEPLEEYYTTEARIFESVTSAYAPLHWPDWNGDGYNALTVCNEIMGEDFWVGGSNNTDNQHWHKLFNFDGSSIFTLSSLWSDFYSGIKRCNDVVKYTGWGRNKGLNPEVMDTYEMEARVLRVFYYGNMWKFYGNIPFYLENLSYPYTAPQKQADEIYESLITELGSIIDANKLPMQWKGQNLGRVTNATAMMLYAELAMYQNDETRMRQAFTYMQKIIDSGIFALNPDYNAIWEESGEWCSESIFEINYNDGNAQRDWGDAARNAGGTVLPTLIGPEKWPGGDGWDGGDGWGFLPMRLETYEMYDAADVRRDASCWDVRGVEYTMRYQDTHMWLKKYRPQTANCEDCPGSKNLNFNNNLRVYRYAETLLNAAELIVRGYGSGDAQKYLDMIRTRAGLSSITANLDNIIEERHLEFVGEGKRYFDLVRMEDVAASTKKASNTLVPDAYGYRTNSWTKSKKHIPLAQKELDADPTLVQNKY